MGSRSDRVARRRLWWDLIERMFEECRAHQPRAVTYWAQQLAYAPVVPHALSLWLRDYGLPGDRTAILVELLQLALAGLDRVPEAPGTPGGALTRLAQRQARALALGRRSYLRGLLRRVGGREEVRPGEVPARMLKAYPLVGWDPPGADGGPPRSRSA